MLLLVAQFSLQRAACHERCRSRAELANEVRCFFFLVVAFLVAPVFALWAGAIAVQSRECEKRTSIPYFLARLTTHKPRPLVASLSAVALPEARRRSEAGVVVAGLFWFLPWLVS